MRQGEKIALGAGLLVAGVYFFKGRALGNLIINPGQISQMYFDGSGPVIVFTLSVANTSSVGLRIDSIAGNIYSNGTLIGNISSFLPVLVAANNQSFIEVSARLRILGLVNDLIRSYTYKNFQQNIKLQGFANVEGIQMPLDLDFTVGN